MIRITDQYFWNLVFVVFFTTLFVMGIIILDTEARISPSDLTILDISLLALASWRLIRLFLFDTITKWFREQFWDVKKVGKGIVLEKPLTGPRRTIADLMSCPWCFGLWAASFVVFFYLLTPIAFYPTLILAISALATFLHNLSCLIYSKIDNNQ
jgi:hypothetical protein